MMHLKKGLLMLILLLCCSLVSISQAKMQVDIETYRKNLYERDSLRAEVRTLRNLQEDTARLHQLVALKDRAFNMLREQMLYNREMVDTLTSIKEQQAGIISDLDRGRREDKAVIEALQKRKVTVWRQVVQFFAGVGVGVIVGKL